MTPIVCKADVVFGGFAPALVRILLALSRLSDRYVVMITSGSEGQHTEGSRHYTFEACDVKSKHFSEPQRAAFVADLARELGPAFTILLEQPGQPNEHVHIQPRRGSVYSFSALKDKI